MSALEPVADRRAIIDRRELADRIAAVRPGKRRTGEIAKVLAEALASGREEIARRLSQAPGRGRAAARATAFLHDQIVRLAYDSVAPDTREIAVVGLGGTGRGELAPFSDVDLMFLTAAKPSADDERTAEAVLHLLWDLNLKVGHSLRSVAELIALSKKDMTVRTAFLEARLLWGEERLFDLALRRFRKEVVAGTAAQFVAAKLAERDARHVKMGDSRYVVEPNVKDGKGGL
ncbi:MAG: bifunctional uridylyltransferase/uridylyl-removing protein, partial [Sphingomicrobium sp.]